MISIDIQKEYKSSAINNISYDENRAVLIVDFTTGTSYEYYKVPLEVFKKFEAVVYRAKENMAQDSIGQLFHHIVKPFYKYKRIR